MTNRTRLSAVFMLFLICLVSTRLSLADESSLLEQRKGAAGNFFHTGMWVDDMNEMLEFLSLLMDYQIVSRGNRPAGGERVMISDSNGQILEFLSDPDSVKAHEEFSLHPLGRIAGIAHISIQVEDVEKLKVLLVENAYPVLAQVPADYSEGYITKADSKYRILFVRGPSAVSFELFEIK